MYMYVVNFFYVRQIENDNTIYIGNVVNFGWEDRI